MLLTFYEARRGADFDARIELALQMLLSSPEFLLRVERDAADVARGVHRISDLELASRLSFFLWSSIPDDELLDVAERGRLKEPAMLDRQVRRMLADERSRALVDNFAGQWLVLRNIRDVTPDPDVFPDFDDNLRDAFLKETELFVESQIRGDRSLLELRERELHLPERAAGTALRDPERLWRPLQTGDARAADPSRRTAHPRQPADGDVVPEPDVARPEREVAARERDRYAATGAAARMCRP